MKTHFSKITLGTAAAVLFGAICAGPAQAQDGPPPGGPPPGMIFGAVQSVDSSAGTITLQTPRGESCTVHVSSSTTIRGQKTISASDLKIGQHVMVHGIPTGLSADSLVTADSESDLMPGRPHGGDQGGPGNGPGGPGGPGGGDMMHGGPPPMMGTITGLHPLTISTGGGVSVAITLKPSAKVSQIISEPLRDIKAGDHVMAMGDPNDDGSIDARQVGVNLPMPGPMGHGGFGHHHGGWGGGGNDQGQGPPPDGGDDQGPPPPAQ